MAYRRRFYRRRHHWRRRYRWHRRRYHWRRRYRRPYRRRRLLPRSFVSQSRISVPVRYRPPSNIFILKGRGFRSWTSNKVTFNENSAYLDVDWMNIQLLSFFDLNGLNERGNIEWSHPYINQNLLQTNFNVGKHIKTKCYMWPKPQFKRLTATTSTDPTLYTNENAMGTVSLATHQSSAWPTAKFISAMQMVTLGGSIQLTGRHNKLHQHTFTVPTDHDAQTGWIPVQNLLTTNANFGTLHGAGFRVDAWSQTTQAPSQYGWTAHSMVQPQSGLNPAGAGWGGFFFKTVWAFGLIDPTQWSQNKSYMHSAK
nr:unknown [Sea turtle tornovirus 1]